jgi:hypothetical protein
MTEWESVSAPRGQFFSWGNDQGQSVTGKVIAFDASGDQDLKGNPVPSLSIELTENTVSIKAKKNERTELEAGSTVRLTVSQGDLKGALIKAAPRPGDMLKITLDAIVTTRSGNTAKNFDVKIARGVAPAPAPVQPATQQGGQLFTPASDPWAASAPF